ncbi:MAG: hypothetical protein IEMM0006_0206 [bacterium]|nr:MAG: hypothetical protein IEMM0006_0206 [bacterium]
MKQKGIFFSALFSGILLFSGVSCQNSHNRKSKKEQTALVDTATFHPGVIYEKVKSLGYPGESYALILPRNYIATKKFPVVFFFDAQARGWLPVKRYQPLADSFGFILVASNNSENGQDAQERNRIIYNFMQDVEQRFSVDPGRIYTGGFSGGARIAAGIGLANKNIAGTIGSAAGFPQLDHIVNTRLAYVGIVGNKDFNYLEMKSLDRELEAAHRHHSLLVFNGHHQWPPLQTMKKAFYFLQTDAMRRQLIPIDKTTIVSLKKNFEKERTMAIRNKNLLLQMRTDRQLVAFLNGLADVGVYENEIRRLLNNPVLKRQQQQLVVLKKEEQKWQQIYSQALKNRDAGWWKNALGNLAHMMRSAKTPEEKHMVRRLYNYLSLMSYLYADGSLKNNQTTAAGKYLMIYQTVDPKNPEVYFLKARRFAMTGETRAVLPSLQKAADNGFHDVKRMENNPYFAGLQQNPVFLKILLQVKENKKKTTE